MYIYIFSENDKNHPESFRVLIGNHDLNAKEPHEVILPIKHIVIHERYDEDTIQNDIALVMLGTDIKYSAHVMAVCLDANQIRSDAECVAAGWGRTLGE